MKKLLSALLALILLLGMSVPAMAATNLTKYTLIVDGEAVALDSSTGWLGRSGSRLTVPVAKICAALGLSPTQNDAHTRLSVTTAEGKTVEVARGYKFIRVDGKKVSMRSKAYRKSGVLMADALMGEVTPAMAAAVGQSAAYKVLVPTGRCGVTVVGAGELPLARAVEKAAELAVELSARRRQG